MDKPCFLLSSSLDTTPTGSTKYSTAGMATLNTTSSSFHSSALPYHFSLSSSKPNIKSGSRGVIRCCALMSSSTTSKWQGQSRRSLLSNSLFLSHFLFVPNGMQYHNKLTLFTFFAWKIQYGSNRLQLFLLLPFLFFFPFVFAPLFNKQTCPLKKTELHVIRRVCACLPFEVMPCASSLARVCFKLKSD